MYAERLVNARECKKTNKILCLTNILLDFLPQPQEMIQVVNTLYYYFLYLRPFAFNKNWNKNNQKICHSPK